MKHIGSHLLVALAFGCVLDAAAQSSGEVQVNSSTAKKQFIVESDSLEAVAKNIATLIDDRMSTYSQDDQKFRIDDRMSIYSQDYQKFLTKQRQIALQILAVDGKEVFIDGQRSTITISDLPTIAKYYYLHTGQKFELLFPTYTQYVAWRYGFSIRELRDTVRYPKVPELKDFDFSSRKINDLDGILDIPGIRETKEITLAQNLLQNISLLASLKQLEYLDLEMNQISDISSLAGCTNLKSLHLDSNRIENISVIKNFTQLEMLVLSNNRIKDVSALAGLKNIKPVDYLLLDGNPIQVVPPFSEVASDAVKIAIGSAKNDKDQTLLQAASKRGDIPMFENLKAYDSFVKQSMQKQ